MGPRLEVVVIADDLTGAADTGVQFAAIGHPVYLTPVEHIGLEAPRRDAAASLAVYTHSRHLCAAAAAARLRSTAQALPSPRPRWVYKKIDSCLRGNPGAEIDVLIDTLGFHAALVAPALPAQGRTTIQGVHRVHGVPLTATEFARDPVAPVTRSAVAAVLSSQSRHAVGHIHIHEYGDLGHLGRALERECARGCRLIVCDATAQTHLDQVAELVVRSPRPLLPVGSAGLAASLARQLSPSATGRLEECPRLEQLLLICGTGSPVTREQVAVLLGRYRGVRRELDPVWLARASAVERRRCAGELTRAWADGVLALQLRSLPPAVGPVSPSAAARGLARLGCELVRASGVEVLFLSGGDTAAAFFGACGAQAIRLQREVLPGLVLGRWLGGPADGLPVITKAGAFGEAKTLMLLYAQLSGGIAS